MQVVANSIIAFYAFVPLSQTEFDSANQLGNNTFHERSVFTVIQMIFIIFTSVSKNYLHTTSEREAFQNHRSQLVLICDLMQTI